MTEPFLKYLRLEKRFSEHTVISYKNDLDQFFTFLQKTYDTTEITAANQLVVRSWIVHLIENKLSPRSAARKLTALKSYYKYLVREGVMAANPIASVSAPKSPKQLPVFVEKDKMDFLLDKIEFSSDFEGTRDKLILELFYATGMRLSELLHIKDQDIDLPGRQVKVLGKRNKERIIPFNNQIMELIEGYLQQRNELSIHTKKKYFFVLKNGNKLYPEYVYRIVKKYLSQVTTLGKRSPHVLRHTFATHMLNNGADINAIKELLGHASLAATQVYTHNTVEKLKKVHKQAHPKG